MNPRNIIVGLFALLMMGTGALAQAGDPRITQLEEQVRSLSGTIEELNFQILQMQEQLRKMQEDNEFRFQELEKKSDAGASAPSKAAEAPPAGGVQTTDKSPRAVVNDQPMDDLPAEGQVAGDVAEGQATGDAATGDAALGKTFGTITFDKDGNVTGVKPGSGTGTDQTAVAALPSTDDPEELYRNAYEFILSGDYGTAEQGFRDHIDRFPADAKTADAHFWLGEALLGQQKYSDAAEVFLAANRDFPSSKKAPDMLFKLGVSLAGMNQRDIACATFAEVGKRYPSAPPALAQRVKQEQALAAC